MDFLQVNSQARRAKQLLVNFLVPLLLGCSMTSWAADAHVAPKLVASSAFALPGGQLRVTITGTPGAAVRLQSSLQPAELHLGTTGTQFLKSGTQADVVAGILPAAGKLTSTVSIRTNATLGEVHYLQAVSELNGQRLLSNGLAYRVQAALPSGPRKTISLAVTPDGTRAFVADKLSGVVTMLDAVNDTKLADLPITLPAAGLPFRPVRLAIDPEGRHAFVSNAAASTLTVIHAASGSVAAQIPVPRGSRGVGFDFRNGERRVYVANETRNAVLVYTEAPLGTFTAAGSIPLRSTSPGPLLVLPSGRLAVGMRTENVIEILDPKARAGSTTVASTSISGTPYELAWSGTDVLIPTFVVLGEDRTPGFNRVLRMHPTNFKITGDLFSNIATDYSSIAVRPTTQAASLIAVGAAGTGTALVANGANGALLDHVQLTYGYPDGTPQDLAIVNSPTSGLPAKIYVVDLFRETVLPILLGNGPPYGRGAEIALAWSGQVRVPFSGALSAAEDGEWTFRSVTAFGGQAFAPNPVTCNVCHTEGASDNSRIHNSQVPAVWGAIETLPYFWDGSVPTIDNLVNGALLLHNHTGVIPPVGTKASILSFLNELQAPASIFLKQDGKMTPDQAAGKRVFEGDANCVSCHAGSAFIPPEGSPRTIEAGIGTGLVPANVPSLRGAWASAPYLNQGQAKTLTDVFKLNPADAHGQSVSGLSRTQLRQLVEYLKSF